MEDGLRFVEAARVKAQETALAELEVLTGSGTRVGELTGFVLDPAQRRVRFAVVKDGWLGRRRFLVPMEEMRLDPDRRALLVEFADGELNRCAAFRAREYPVFSDEDLLIALFGCDAA
jgi:hypothetical protein